MVFHVTSETKCKTKLKVGLDSSQLTLSSVGVLEILDKAEEFRESVSKIAYDIERELNDVCLLWAVSRCCIFII